MLTALVAVVVMQSSTPADLLDNAEIGDAVQSMQLRPRGYWAATVLDAAKGKTTLEGTWKADETTLTVKPAKCRGPACKAVQKEWTAKVTVAAARAMLVDSKAPAPLFPSGSYYCHYLGCEQRIGVEVLSKEGNLRALHAVEDHLIGKNVGRNRTVVWVGPRPAGETKTTRIEVCGREPERAKAALAMLQEDVADAPWLGPVTVVEAMQSDCQWDVRLFVKDDVAPPAKQPPLPQGRGLGRGKDSTQ